MTTTLAPPTSRGLSSVQRRPEPGQVVRVRTRTYLVGPVEKQPNGSGTLVRLACLDDDAQGQTALQAVAQRDGFVLMGVFSIKFCEASGGLAARVESAKAKGANAVNQ